MLGSYRIWLGEPVVLQLATQDLQVSLQGMILSETEDSIRFQIGNEWEVDIFKVLIQSVEDRPLALAAGR